MKNKSKLGQDVRNLMGTVDSPTTKDLLDFKQLAIPLANKISSTNKDNTPLTIGIYGEWGSGKTSFLMMVDEELRREGIHSIWFNAWKYDQEENLWSALIQTILGQARVSGNFIQRAWIKIKLWFSSIDLRTGIGELSRKLIPLIFRLILFLLSIGIFLGWNITEIQKFLSQLFGGTFQDYSWVVAVVIKIAVPLAGIVAAKPEVLFQLFDSKLGIDFTQFSRKHSYLEHISFLDKFSSELQHLIQRISRKKPLVVIIDDLDRCLPDKAIQVLEAIKLFLDVKNCVFILAVDREIVEKVISLKYKDLIDVRVSEQNTPSPNLASSLSENYFEKIIQLPISLPPLSREKMEHFISQLYPNGQSEIYSKIFASGLPKNPRKVKRILQIFLFLQSIAHQKIEQGNIQSTLLAKLVIIQNQFRLLYSEIVENPEILRLLEEYYKTPDDELNSFLQSIEVSSVRDKVTHFSVQYLAVKEILLLSINENDTFSKVKISDYVFIVNSIADERSTTTSLLAEQPGFLFENYLQIFLSNYQSIISGNFMELNFLPRLTKEKDELLTVSLQQLIKRHNRIVILGSPGSGKTTQLIYIAMANANSLLRKELKLVESIGLGEPLIPILLPLNSLKGFLNKEEKTLSNQMLDFILEYLQLSYSFPKKRTSEFFTEALERGKCILLLDGFDEINTHQRFSVTESLNSLLAIYPLNKVIVTTRPYAIDNLNQLKSFDFFEIQPLNIEQIRQFIKGMYHDEQAQMLISVINTNDRLADMASTPLFLSLISQMYTQYGSVSDDQEQMISIYVDTLLKRWIYAKGTSSDVEISIDEVREILSEIASIMREKGIIIIDRSEIIKIIKEITGKPTEFASRFLTFISETSGLLREVGPEKFTFIHNILLDYFANIKEKSNLDRVEVDRESSTLTDSVYVDDKLFLGRLEEQKQFRSVLKEVLTTPQDEDLPYILLLFGGCGMGKTMLAKRFREIAQVEQPFEGSFRTIWIDWEDELRRYPELQVDRDRINAETVFDVIHAKAVKATWGRHFGAYQEVVKKRGEAEKKAAETLSDSAGRDDLSALRGASARAIARILRESLPIGDTGENLAKEFLEVGIKVGAEQASNLRAALQNRFRARLDSSQFDILLNPNEKLARALADGLKKVSASNPLIVFLDTYEIVDRADLWLREVICAAGPRVVWVVSGRNNLMRSGQFGIEYFKGYADDFPRRLFAYDMRQLAEQDVRTLFTYRAPDRQLDDTSVQAISQVTRGVPLALAVAAEMWAKGIPLALIVGESDERTPSKEIVQRMTARYLLHAVVEADKQALFALALACGNIEILRAMLRPIDISYFDVDALLRRLERDYSFVHFERARLADEPAFFLREYLKDEAKRTEDRVKTLNQRATEALRARLKKLQANLRNLEDRCIDDEWIKTVHNLAEYLFWLDEGEAWHWLIPRLVEGLAYSYELRSGLFQIAKNWEDFLSKDGKKRVKALRAANNLNPSPNERAELLGELTNLESLGWLRGEGETERRAILDWQRGKLLYARGKFSDALAQYESVEQALPENGEVLKKQLGEALYELAGKLIWANNTDNAFYSTEMEHAVANWQEVWRIRLQSSTGLLEGKAIALLSLGKKDEALQVLKEAISQMLPGDSIEFDLYTLLQTAPVPLDGLEEMVALLEGVLPKRHGG